MGNIIRISFILTLLFTYSTEYVIAQNFIGEYKDDIRKNVKTVYPGFVFEKEVINGNRSFVKFVNTFEDQTLLFIINDQGYCTSISRMYNTWLFNQVKEDLNRRYMQKDSLTWVDSIGNEKFEIKLKKGEWFLTVVTRPYSKNK